MVVLWFTSEFSPSVAPPLFKNVTLSERFAALQEVSRTLDS
jgi:hypothetical protein